MFTGIITHIAKVKNLSRLKNQDLLITLEVPKIDRKLEIGCSIACNGVCLTLVKKTQTLISFQASPETLNKTNVKNWKIGDKINIEFSLRMGDELGGHLVLGHVDKTVKVKQIKAVNKDSTCFVFELPKNFQKFITPKGSVVLNGASLTINKVSKSNFDVNIIKHTLNHTNFSELKIGDEINLEIDMIARYLEKLIKS